MVWLKTSVAQCLRINIAQPCESRQAVSELIRRTSAGPMPVKQVDGVWVFDLPPGTPRVSSRRVKELLEDFP